MTSPVSSPVSRPVYVRLLRLKNVHPNGVQRALLGEGVAVLAAVLWAADLASAWAVLVLPVAVAVVVKAHDLLAGFLARGNTNAAAPEGTTPSGAGNAQT